MILVRSCDVEMLCNAHKKTLFTCITIEKRTNRKDEEELVFLMFGT